MNIDIAMNQRFITILYIIESGWFKAEEIERKTIPYNREANARRIIFEGEVAEDAIRKKYIGKSVAALYKRGEANPVKAFFKDKNI